jgi:hypothetical protein
MTTVFAPRPLPAPLAEQITARLAAAHAAEPFATSDPRPTVQRVAALLGELGATATAYRGGLDLAGSEVDHVWLRVEGDGGPCVVDLAFPLHDPDFVDLLRRYVAGDAGAEALDRAGCAVGVEARVLGTFPHPLRYLGAPVWSARG